MADDDTNAPQPDPDPTPPESSTDGGTDPTPEPPAGDEAEAADEGTSAGVPAGDDVAEAEPTDEAPDGEVPTAEVDVEATLVEVPEGDEVVEVEPAGESPDGGTLATAEVGDEEVVGEVPGGEVVAEVVPAGAEVTTEADPDDDVEPSGEGEPGLGGRKVVVVGGIVVVVLACLVAAVAWLGGDDGADDPQDEAGAEGDGEETPDPTSAGPTTTGAPAVDPADAGFLSELTPVESDRWAPAEGSVGIGGTAFDGAVVSDPIGGCAETEAQTVTYDLDGKLTRLSGTLGLTDDSPPDRAAEISFSVDGEEVYWRSFVQGEASRIQLDLTGVQELTVTAAPVFTGDSCVQAAFADLALS